MLYQDGKCTHHLPLLAKEEMLVMDAEAYIRKTSRAQSSCRTKYDWILYPDDFERPVSKPTVATDESRSESGVLVSKTFFRRQCRVPSKVEISIKPEPERNCRKKAKSNRSISSKDAHGFAERQTPPPAPSPPRLPTPDLEEISESAFWSCSKFHDQHHKRIIRG